MCKFVTITLIFLTNIAFSSEYIVRTKETGFYKITSTDINKLNSKNTPISVGDLTLKNASGELPYFFTSGKSNLEEDNELIFFAEALKGVHAKQHPHDDDNGLKIYKSKTTDAINNWQTLPKSLDHLPVCEKLYSRNHYEANKLLIRVNKIEYKKEPELWYWKKLSYLLKNGFTVPLDVKKSKPNSDLFLTVALRSRNIDKQAADTNDHEVEVLINNTLVDTLKWDGKIQYISEKISIPKNMVKPNKNTITFKVPKRKVDNKPIIDLSLLDYFQIDYEIDPTKISASDPITSPDKCKIELSETQFAYSQTNKLFGQDYIEVDPKSKVYIGDIKTIKTPGINYSKPFQNDLAETEYLMITHPLFKDKTEEFADYYNKKGIKTKVVDTEQIYQRYSYGVRELYAIKDLIKETHTESNGGLKYVLLVGDSSWDWRDNGKKNLYGKIANSNDGFMNFPHQKSYTNEYINRDFVPTGQYHSSQGHSASDNWFVSIIPEKVAAKGEDFIPDLAIGRFPVSTNEELDAMINKTINYAKNTKVGPWKSRILWITNSNKHYQKKSIKTSKALGEFGVKAKNIFPKVMDGDNFKVQETLSSSFDDGNLIVHFVGHGGKSIWRIGPPDIKKNRDLFTLDHITNLNNSKTLPFVMSMSCFSAPFDHPFADSIGEKFIREPNVGALAVLASSWRNTPNDSFSRYILKSLFENPEFSIGQAVLAGKRHFRGRTMVEMYNLLGDPAVRLAIPTLNMTSDLSLKTVNSTIETQSFNGKVKIDLLDDTSNVLSTHELEIDNPDFTFEIDEIPSNCTQGRVYAWDTKQNIDAMSAFDCSAVTN